MFGKQLDKGRVSGNVEVVGREKAGDIDRHGAREAGARRGNGRARAAASRGEEQGRGGGEDEEQAAEEEAGGRRSARRRKGGGGWRDVGTREGGPTPEHGGGTADTSDTVGIGRGMLVEQ